MSATLLRVNLTKGTWTAEDVSALERKYLGGLGVNTALALDLIPAGADPLSEENVLIFGVGPLVGTLLPTACRTEITAKSPLTDRFGTSNAGGEFGARLKMAGYSYLALEGAASKPVYLVIDRSGISIEPADELWTKDTWGTVEALKNKYGSDYQIASIGPAGEHRVRYANIVNNYYAAWGRTGMGAVMGSKKVKAVAVYGQKPVQPVSRTAFMSVMKEGFERVTNDPSFGPIKRFGSMLVSDPFNSIGGLPGNNFTRGTLADWSATRGRKSFEKLYKEKDIACFTCPIACAHWSKVKDGDMKGYETKGLEVAFVTDVGAKLGIKDAADIFRVVELCNRMGMDIVSASGCVSFAIEAARDKRLQLDLDWGESGGILQLLGNIALREGLGDILAEGTRRAAAQLALSQYAVEVKGLELPHRDPRAKWDVWTLGYLTNSRGGDSLRTRSPVEAVLGKVMNYQEEASLPPETVEYFDAPVTVKKQLLGEPPGAVDIARMARYSEDLITIINSVGMCIRPPVLRSLGPDYYARALNAVQGTNYTEEEVLSLAAAVYDLQHRFNVREGETIADYAFPERFYTKPLPAGDREIPPLDRAEVEKVVEKYFQVRGWEK